MDSYATEKQLHLMTAPVSSESHKPRLSLPSILPIGASWQQIYLLARRQKKIYVQVFDFGPINLTLSFSSAPWMLRNRILTAGESVIHRGLTALADVEGARIHLKQLTITHQIASLESLQEILVRHYTRQLLHEMYKVFGSAGVIGNPLGFTRSMGLGIRDFLSVPARSIFLGIVAFTFDDQAVSEVEQQQSGIATHSKGVINGVSERLTGLLQSPIKGAEKHGLPGVLSGIALGITGLVAKRAASILESILEVTGKTAESIRNRSRLYQMGQQRFRVRLPRPLSRELPVRPYSWEDAVGTSALVEADDSLRLKDEILVMCKELRQAGKFVIITQRLVLIVSCSNLVDLGKPEFRGVPADLHWEIESEIRLESVIHADCDEGVVHIVGSSSDAPLRQNQQAKRSSGARAVRWSNPTGSQRRCVQFVADFVFCNRIRKGAWVGM
ncbi:intermembrane lipid transfer protein VPS13-like [Malus domestica]|uniref:intermembrane lipid transfer protein VPS13-like n=1 Tax=Malus domestica TaxID=3750 RepID=UPI003976B39A